MIDTAEANSACVGAFVTTSGGVTSHAAIVAKGRGIPYVSSINFSALELPQNGLVIVDGRTGEVIFNPCEETVARYQHLRDQLNLHMLRLNQASMLEAETYDGYKVKLSANVETIGEIDVLHQYGGNGVGLLRTESVFLTREDFPSE
jgi:phosphotransferase system enzyme I (PtsI)